MIFSRPFPPPLLLACLIPVLAASNCKKPPDSLADEVVEGSESTFPSPDEVLQIAAMEPSQSQPDVEVLGRVYGAGFKEGARVQLGVLPMEVATFVDENTLEWTFSGLESGYYDLTVINPDARKSTLHRALYVSSGLEDDCRHVRLYFDLDKAGLTTAAESLLDAKSECYHSANGRINVEGHADERGTTDYNLALGQRRADSVVRRLVGKGLAPSRISTLSYGEERPLNEGQTEDAWSQNRRAEIRLAID
jgi:peptidoglycan-associated lipoprotein